MSVREAYPTLGFFDSGVGGLSVWREVIRRLPQLPTLYVADNAHIPYGPRPPAQVRAFSHAITRFLIKRAARLIVVACNTASAAALTSLRSTFDVPFVGMEPAVKPAAANTQTKHIGVLATQGTLDGELFRTTAHRYARGVVVHVQVGDGLVDRVEEGQIDHPQTEALLRRYLEPMLEAQVDHIVLGCTHYSFLLPVIRRLVPPEVTIVDPACAVARQVQRLVAQQFAIENVESGGGDSRPPISARFFVSGRSDTLRALARPYLDSPPQVERLRWQDGDVIEDD